VVTGAARGIGRAIAEAFAREGADVALLDRRSAPEGVEATEAIRSLGAKADFFAADVSDPGSVERAFAAMREKFDRIDILVNNAGITQRKAFSELTIEDWDRVLGVNLRGLFLVTWLALPLMSNGANGRIINIASQMGQRGGALLVPYSASKAGVIGFTKALARELAPNITVNAIAPGPVMTDLIRDRPREWFEEVAQSVPLGRFGRPEEVAATAVFLASDDGALYTGQTLGPNSGDVML
jgi:3-oxoacyl-[acyl-carrier protein] reductase